MSETGEQIALIHLIDYLANQYPSLKFLAHVPNGEYRDKKTAKKLKSMGVRAGVPDLLLFLRSDGYVGLAIEMKSEKGTLRDAQKLWRDHLERQGWKYVVCRSVEEATGVIFDYAKISRLRLVGFDY